MGCDLFDGDSNMYASGVSTREGGADFYFYFFIFWGVCNAGWVGWQVITVIADHHALRPNPDCNVKGRHEKLKKKPQKNKNNRNEQQS